MPVRDGLLALLEQQDRYGYQLKVDFEEATGGIWVLNVGQVYSTLDRLRRDGLVAVDTDGDDDQKRYSLTADGREAVGAWWQTVPAEDPPPRDELQLKVLMAIEHGGDHAIDVITSQRTALISMLQKRRRDGRARVSKARRKRRERDEADERRAELARQLVTDAQIVRAEADLRWLDLCEARLLKPQERSDET